MNLAQQFVHCQTSMSILSAPLHSAINFFISFSFLGKKKQAKKRLIGVVLLLLFSCLVTVRVFGLSAGGALRLVFRVSWLSVGRDLGASGSV